MRSKMDNMNILASMYREIDTRSMDDDDDDDDDADGSFSTVIFSFSTCALEFIVVKLPSSCFIP